MEAGRLMIIGLAGPTFDSDARALLEDVRPLGVILFARNMPDRASLERLVEEIRRHDEGLLLAIDHEGGRVDRLPEGCTHFPPALAIARSSDPGVTREVGRCQGRELRALGFDINFAPVLDIHTNPANPVIGDRAFGTTPEEVIHYALPYLQGLTEAGVLGCAKHFPGHGDTSTDSHLELPVVRHDAKRLRSVEMAPFARAVGQHPPMVMTAHVVYESLDPTAPASLSPAVVAGCLRGELGFDGVVVSDDLEMKAISDGIGIEAAAVLAVQAGSDVILVCKTPSAIRKAHGALQAAIDQGDIPAEAQAAAERRLARLGARARKLRGAAADRAAIGCDAHRGLAARLAEKHSGCESAHRGE